MSYLLSEFELYRLKKNPKTSRFRLDVIANYQLKYWVFGVPGQQMGRELKLIAGGAGKLRLGFVSLCLRETRSRMNGAAAAECYENKEDWKMKR
jgi:hypothetical protein